MNGETITVNGIEFKVGNQYTIAGKSHIAYNTMPDLSLVAFVQLTKSGKPSAKTVSLSYTQINSLVTVGAIS
jgi:hypothetical protein